MLRRFSVIKLTWQTGFASPDAYHRRQQAASWQRDWVHFENGVNRGTTLRSRP